MPALVKQLCCAWRRSLGVLAVLSIALVHGTPVYAAQAQIEAPEIRVLAELPEEAQASTEAARANGCCEDLASRRSRTPPKKTATVTMQTLYSAQAGSWMFESLVHNGLFKVASAYQPSHPRAVMINDGAIDLAELVQALNDPRIMSHHAASAATELGSFTLHYPVIIGPNATLIIENAEFRLNADSGAALINLGTLDVRDSRLSPVRQNARGGKHFRPFILAWNASSTVIIDSELHRLGYNAFLSQGLTVADHPDLDRSKRARILLSGTNLTWLESGLITQGAEVRATNNTISNAQRYGIDSSGGSLVAVQNTITGTRYNNGIRATDIARVSLRNNRISDTHQSGILLTGAVEQAALVGNHVENARSDGLAIRDVPQFEGQLVNVVGNVLSGNAKSGLRLSNAPSTRIFENVLMANAEYGLNIDRSLSGKSATEASESATLIVGNQLIANREASIKTVRGGRLVFGQNRFEMSPTFQSVFAGDLIAMQTELLDHLVAHQRVLEVIP